MNAFKETATLLWFVVSATPPEIPFIDDSISESALEILPLKVFNLSVSSKSWIIPTPFLSFHPLLSFFLRSFSLLSQSLCLISFPCLLSYLSLSLSLSGPDPFAQGAPLYSLNPEATQL